MSNTWYTDDLLFINVLHFVLGLFTLTYFAILDRHITS